MRGVEHSDVTIEVAQRRPTYLVFPLFSSALIQKEDSSLDHVLNSICSIDCASPESQQPCLYAEMHRNTDISIAAADHKLAKGDRVALIASYILSRRQIPIIDFPTKSKRHLSRTRETGTPHRSQNLSCALVGMD
jgi:hypothetical protein